MHISRAMRLSLSAIGGILITFIGAMVMAQSLYTPSGNADVVQAEKYPYIVLGMGCFWGAEKRMQALPGVVTVESGYAGGDYANATYNSLHDVEAKIENGAKRINHAEVVKVYYDPQQTSLTAVLAQFWESHNPTQGNRQGNDVGSTYRSAIYYQNAAEQTAALHTKSVYQANLKAAGQQQPITTEIAPLRNYATAETYHQNYLQKNPLGYCGLGGAGVKYFDKDSKSTAAVVKSDNAASPVTSKSVTSAVHAQVAAELWVSDWKLEKSKLHSAMQLIAFEAEGCAYCEQFNQQVLRGWKSPTPIVATHLATPPTGWELKEPLFATPTIVLFKQGKEVARYTGYQGKDKFWKWIGFETLSDEQKHIAYSQGTERPFSGEFTHEKRAGTYVDPITGAALFRSDTKFDSGTGWPSFFQPIEGSVSYKQDGGHGMQRTEVLSASSGIHLGHVFDDGPAPSGKRFCINSKVLTFVPDAPTAMAK